MHEEPEATQAYNTEELEEHSVTSITKRKYDHEASCYLWYTKWSDGLYFFKPTFLNFYDYLLFKKLVSFDLNCKEFR